MSVLVESSSVQSGATSGTSLVITKPTGLTSGDLMVCFFSFQNTSDISTTPSGWSKLSTFIVSDSYGAVVFYKVADSSDVAASNFTFSVSSSVTARIGCLMRISGYSSQIIPNYSINPSKVADSKTPSISNGISTFTNSLILALLLNETTENYTLNGSLSNLAIANTNPTWTAINNQSVSPGNNSGNINLYYGERTTSNNSTGNTSWTITTSASAGSISSNAILLNIVEPKDFTISETITSTESYIKEIQSTFTDIISTIENYNYEKSREWTRESKPTTTWVKEQK